MFGQLIRLKVHKDKVAEFEKLVSTLVANIRASEPEPKTYEVRRAAEPLTYVYFISFTDADAYQRYAIAANRTTTNLATFRAIAKKYPNKDAADILRDLVKSEPGAEGKWFAAAKDAGLFDVAIELARLSPTDPRTLTRAARDFAIKRPEFALAAGLTALGWMARGHGYELTGLDVHAAYDAVMQASLGTGMDDQQVKAQMRQMIDVQPSVMNFVQKILQVQLSH